MFTREELFEYFSGQYTSEQIMNALHQLSKHDNEIDPEADEFPVTITERLEQTFKIVEDAVSQQKALTGNTSSLGVTEVEKLAIEIATERAANIPADVFRGMVEIIAGEAMSSTSRFASTLKPQYFIKFQMQSSSTHWLI
jgi:3-hydroxyacyl-CoA dehydrogenase